MERHPTEQKILDETIRIIETSGETNVRVHDIEVAVGITAPSIYHFFGNREGLVAEAQAERFLRSFQELDRFLDLAVASVKSRDDTRAALRQLLKMIFDPSRAQARQHRLAAMGSAEGRPELALRIAERQALSDDLGIVLGDGQRVRLVNIDAVPLALRLGNVAVDADAHAHRHNFRDAVAERLGKPRATIANSVRLLALDPAIQGFLRKGQLSAGHAKALLGVENPAHRMLVARLVIEKGLSVRATEAEVRKLGASKKGQRKQTVQTVVDDVQKRLASHFASPVSVVRKGTKGSILIPFSSDDELARLLEKIGIKL